MPQQQQSDPYAAFGGKTVSDPYAAFGGRVESSYSAQPKFNPPVSKLQNSMNQYKQQGTDPLYGYHHPPIAQAFSDIFSGKIAKGSNEALNAIEQASFPAIAAFAPELLPAVAAAPLATATSLGASALTGMAAKHVGYEATRKMGLTEDQAKLAGNILSLAGAYGGYKGGTALSKAASGIRSAIADWAQEEPDVAAMRGLGVSPKSKYAGKVLKAINDVRPYMKGVQSELELQHRIPVIKAQVWEPYSDAVQKFGEASVVGPDGITPLAELENERLRLSAINDAAKSKDPIALQKIEQSGRTVAESLKRERSIANEIDSFLERQGVPSKEIRKKYGSLTEVQKRVQGRLGYMVKSNYGLGRVMGGARGGGGIGEGGEFSGHGIFVTERLANILPAINDILAGRPWWSGSPIDIGIKEGFRTGGEVPSLKGIPKSIAGLLEAPKPGLPPDLSVETSGNVPFNIHLTTRAQRLGLLLPEKAGSPYEVGPSSLEEKVPVAERVPGKYAGMLDQNVKSLSSKEPIDLSVSRSPVRISGVAGRIYPVPKGLLDTIARNPELSSLLKTYLDDPDGARGRIALGDLQRRLGVLQKPPR